MYAFHTAAKRAFCVALILVLALSVCAPAYAKVGYTYASRVQGLRVRVKGKSGTAVVAQLKKGEKVIHLGTTKGWWKVKTKDGHVGYVFHTYLKPTTTTFRKNAYYKVVSTSKLSVRWGPRSVAAVKGTIKRGTTVKLKNKQGSWGYVQLGNGNVGWVPLKYLSYYKN